MNHETIVTNALTAENVKTVSKNEPKRLTKTVNISIFYKIAGQAFNKSSHKIHSFLGSRVAYYLAVQEGPWSDKLGQGLSVFACSPLVCVGSLQILRLPPTV